MRRFSLLLGGVIVLVAIAYGYSRLDTDQTAASYRLGTVERGTIEKTISSTGRVKPVMTVDIGSQVSGQISEVLVDFNSKVRAGEVIARIDASPFEARVQVARADLAFAEANIAMQTAALEELQADLLGLKAILVETADDLERQQSLFERKVIPESTVDHAVARHVQAMAKVASIQARMKKQQAQIRTAHANVASHGGKLLQAELELEHTLIRSPVDGIVINRAADTGQTVAASLQAPILFTLAQDLRQIHLEVSVDEADIGGITDGQQSRFSVDAYPDRVFKGEVVQIRKQPIEVSGVVTYVIIVSTQNLDQSLMPGMTASVEIVLGQRQDALKVSSQALRFKPPGFKRSDSGASARGGGRERMQAMIKDLSEKLELSEEQLSSVQSIYAEMGQSIRGLREAGTGSDEFREAIRQLRTQAAQRVEQLLKSDQKKRYRVMRAEAKSGGYRRANVWVLDGGKPVALGLTVGISDSTHTEIVRGDIAQGAQVIVGLSSDGS